MLDDIKITIKIAFLAWKRQDFAICLRNDKMDVIT